MTVRTLFSAILGFSFFIYKTGQNLGVSQKYEIIVWYFNWKYIVQWIIRELYRSIRWNFNKFLLWIHNYFISHKRLIASQLKHEKVGIIIRYWFKNIYSHFIQKNRIFVYQTKSKGKKKAARLLRKDLLLRN